MPGSRPPADKLYQHLLQLHHDTFEAQRYELSYHVLAAALHAAEELNSVALLTNVQSVAANRQAEIDQLQPEHRISSMAAKVRGNFALFTSLANIAGAARGRIAADQTLGRLRHDATNRVDR
jgi:hypothetical protein